MNHNFHATMEENPHRFLNVMLRGTYVRPHRHLDPPKTEGFLILDGEAGIVCFDNSGSITQSVRLGPGCDAIGADLEAGLWHTIVALSDRAICYEVKPGPYTKANDKDFAVWAPAEGDPQVGEFLARIVAIFN